MHLAGWITLIYGIIILVGGIMGHLKAASKASLISGLVFGLLLIITSVFLFRKAQWGLISALLLTFFLDAFFTYRFFTTMKFLPSGLMSLLSLVVLISLALISRKIAG